MVGSGLTDLPRNLKSSGMAFKATKDNSAQEQSYAHSCLVSSDYQNGDDYRSACMHLPFSERAGIYSRPEDPNPWEMKARS